MAGSDSNMMKEILDEIASYEGLYHPIKCGFWERKFTKMLSPEKLHPNPDDEFSHVDVGPNYSIINNYTMQIRKALTNEEPPLDPDDPLIVEKMFPRGYMLLNGHHRWAAAKQMSLKKVPVEVVNLTHSEDLMKMLDKSDRTKRAAFDLDEVLLASDTYPKEDAPAFPYSNCKRDVLRKGAPALIHELHNRGYDVWIYTASYKSAKYIQSLFKGYGICPDGIVNGLTRKNRKQTKLPDSVKAAMDRKYTTTIHIDTGHILYVDKVTKEYEYVSLENDAHNWASKTVRAIDSLEK